MRGFKINFDFIDEYQQQTTNEVSNYSSTQSYIYNQTNETIDQTLPTTLMLLQNDNDTFIQYCDKFNFTTNPNGKYFECKLFNT